MPMTLRRRFQALFSPTRRWIGAEGEAIQPGGWLGPVEVVVPRTACEHRRLAFPQLAADQRTAALKLAASRALLSEGGRWIARWQDDVAQVWLVDAAVLADVDPAATLVPESGLRPPPATPEATRLLAMREGVEGQVWREGRLFASRWWPSAPDAASWGRFLRSASLTADDVTPPPVETLPLASSPWGRADDRLRWSATQLERAFWRSLGLLAGLLLGWQLVATAVWAIAARWQDAELDRVRGESMPLIEAREQAEAAQARMAAYVDLSNTPVDHVLIGDLKRGLPADARLLAWNRDAGGLRVEVQSATTDPRVFVQAFREHPVLADIVANPSEAGRIVLEVDLDAPAATSPEAAP
ncbi:hypothetical protein [Silanimonas sp.]|jgi:hypothetical protein|uniref:hypothetical protein n=1 Tax=Silanimonas sp. TaxID=1929290 RepID=UPI0037C54452